MQTVVEGPPSTAAHTTQTLHRYAWTDQTVSRSDGHATDLTLRRDRCRVRSLFASWATLQCACVLPTLSLLMPLPTIARSLSARQTPMLLHYAISCMVSYTWPVMLMRFMLHRDVYTPYTETSSLVVEHKQHRYIPSHEPTEAHDSHLTLDRDHEAQIYGDGSPRMNSSSINKKIGRHASDKTVCVDTAAEEIDVDAISGNVAARILHRRSMAEKEANALQQYSIWIRLASMGLCIMIAITCGLTLISMLVQIFPLPLHGVIVGVAAYVPSTIWWAHLYLLRHVKSAIVDERRQVVMVQFLTYFVVPTARSIDALGLVMFVISELYILAFGNASTMLQILLLIGFQMAMIGFKFAMREVFSRKMNSIQVPKDFIISESPLWAGWVEFCSQLMVILAMPNVKGDVAVAFFFVKEAITLTLQPLFDTETGRGQILKFIKKITDSSWHQSLEQRLLIQTSRQRIASLQICCFNFMARIVATTSYLVIAIAGFYGPNKDYIFIFEDMDEDDLYRSIAYASCSILLVLIQLVVFRHVCYQHYDCDPLALFADFVMKRKILLISLFQVLYVVPMLAMVTHYNVLLQN